MLLQLRNKRLHLLVFKGQPKLDIEDTQDLNDGLWHRIVLSREGNRIMMIVDSNKRKRRKGYPKKLNIGNTMYVGGVPGTGLILPDLLVSVNSQKQVLFSCSKHFIRSILYLTWWYMFNPFNICNTKCSSHLIYF